MLHVADTPTYRQTMLMPAAAPTDCDLALGVLGRFVGRGGFDLSDTKQRCSLHLVEAGQGVVTIDGRSWDVGAGDAFAFVPGHRVHYRDLPGRAWRYTWMYLDGGRAMEVLASLGFAPGRWARPGLDLARLRPLLDEIAAALRTGNHGPWFACAAAWRVVDALLPAGDGDRGDRVAHALRAILDEDFRTPLSLAAIARHLGVDRSTLFRRFRAAVGRSPQDYLVSRRLEHARGLLRDPALPVAEAARRSGFADPAWFARAFRREYGTPPSRARGG